MGWLVYCNLIMHSSFALLLETLRILTYTGYKYFKERKENVGLCYCVVYLSYQSVWVLQVEGLYSNLNFFGFFPLIGYFKEDI